MSQFVSWVRDVKSRSPSPTVRSLPPLVRTPPPPLLNDPVPISMVASNSLPLALQPPTKLLSKPLIPQSSAAPVGSIPCYNRGSVILSGPRLPYSPIDAASERADDTSGSKSPQLCPPDAFDSPTCGPGECGIVRSPPMDWFRLSPSQSSYGLDDLASTATPCSSPTFMTPVPLIRALQLQPLALSQSIHAHSYRR